MTQNGERRGSTRSARRSGMSAVGTADTPKNRLFRSLGQTPRYIRWPVYNDDRHLIGHELLKIGPGLDAYIRRMAEEAK